MSKFKVGDEVYIREDLEHGRCYGKRRFTPGMLTGVQKIFTIDYDDQIFEIGVGKNKKWYLRFDYTPEMIDWDKTIKLRREKMNIKDLKVGDVVYIREDVNNLDKKWANKYAKPRLIGVQQIFKVDYDNNYFWIVGELDEVYIERRSYTVEMIDWEKTINLKDIQAKEYLNKKFGSDKVHNPSHYGGGGIHDIECYKAIEYILYRLENVPEKYYGHVSNIVKYIWRCNNKNGYEDLDKATVYFDFMFREEE